MFKLKRAGWSSRFDPSPVEKVTPKATYGSELAYFTPNITPTITFNDIFGNPDSDSKLGNHKQPTTNSHNSVQSKENIENGLYVLGKIGNQQVKFLLDTGASTCLLSKNIFDKLHPDFQTKFLPDSNILIAAGGAHLNQYGQFSTEVCIDGKLTACNFIVADITDDGILGIPFLDAHNSVLDFRNRKFTVDDQPVQCINKEGMVISQRVTCTRTITIPGRHELIIQGKCNKNLNEVEVMLEPSRKIVQSKGLLVAKTVLKTKGRYIPVRVCNVMDEPITVYAGSQLGIVSQTEVFTVIKECEHKINRISVQEQNSNPVPEYLIDLYERSIKDLPQDKHNLVSSFLTKNSDVFAKNDQDLGSTNIVKHDINTGTEPPIKHQPRRFPKPQEQEIEKQVNELLEQGLIKPGNGPWSSPIVLVKKKDGSVRMCVDYRKLNAKTVKDAYPLPRIDDTLDSLADANLFATLDLASGYHQVQNTPQAKIKSAMVTKQGLFEWNVMSFGLTGAPATFQRLMETALRGLQYEVCHIYLDDVIVFAKNEEELIDRLETVLDRFRRANLKLKPKKCVLFRKQVEFLGHIVSANGVATDPKKSEKVMNWPVPKNVSEVRSFLGLCGYYRRFVPNYYTKAKPLHDLTKKSRSFEWTEDCENSFNQLKIALTSAPILGYPKDSGGRFILDCDASNFAIGAVLSQEQNGKEIVIAYSSKSLTKEQRNYCVTRKEFLSIFFHLKYFRNYLWGRNALV